MLIKRETLNRDLSARACVLPNFAATIPPRNVFGTLEFTLDHQPRGYYSPVCAQALNLESQIIPQRIQNLPF